MSYGDFMIDGDLAAREQDVQRKAAAFKTATDAALRAVLEDDAALSVMGTDDLEEMRLALIEAGKAYDTEADAAGVPVVDRFAWQSYLGAIRKERLAHEGRLQSRPSTYPLRIEERD
jgi:hypothetical protein